MDHSIHAVVGSRGTAHLHIINTNYSSWKKFGFAVGIILSLCGLTSVGIGLAGLGVHQMWWTVGILGRLGLIHSIVMITVGGALALSAPGGMTLLTIVIVTSFRNRQNSQGSNILPFDRNPHPKDDGDTDSTPSISSSTPSTDDTYCDFEEIENTITPKIPALEVSQTSNLEKEETAAIKIQSIFRGYTTRVAVRKEKRHFLDYSLFEQAKSYIEEPSKLGKFNRAASGQTPVYLPAELPVVLKHSGFRKNEERFKNMKQARAIADKNGYLNLTIPTARIHRDFIIESRLPIMKHNTKAQIGLYLDHLDAFNPAIEEFTGFLCQADIGDITGGTTDCYTTLTQIPIGRYDNIAMYLEKREDRIQGKIGLVDLERFNPRQNKSCFYVCQETIRLFPHHLDTIINTAKQFNPSIETRREELEQERSCVLEYFEKAYGYHLNFVKQNNIVFTDPAKFKEISPTRKEEIKKAMEAKIRKENDDRYGCLKENSVETLQLLSHEAFSEILDNTIKLVTDLLESNLKNQGGNTAITSYSKLLLVRTLEFDSLSEYRELIWMIESKLSERLVLKYPIKETRIAADLVDVIFKELENGKEVARYERHFGLGNHAVGYICC